MNENIFKYKDVKVKDLKKDYEKEFTPSQEYLDSMPDLQNSEFEGRYIDFVGITNFRVPILIRQRDGGTQQVLASIHGLCDVDSSKLGLNLSRIVRSFYKSKDDVFDINKLEDILKTYKKDQNSLDANIQIEFDYYLKQDSLVSRDDQGNKLWGYYIVHCVLDANLDKDGTFKKLLKVIWQYSSTCPCSTALSQYAMQTRGVGATPHAQRSAVSVTADFDDMVWIEDIVDHCRKSLVTECQAIVKREDEEEFAVKNYSSQKFIEDAVRILAKELDTDTKIKDYKLLAVHNESLHQHSVVGCLCKGIEGSIFRHHVSIPEIRELEMMN